MKGEGMRNAILQSFHQRESIKNSSLLPSIPKQKLYPFSIYLLSFSSFPNSYASLDNLEKAIVQ
jgi:hypothetical protein